MPARADRWPGVERGPACAGPGSQKEAGRISARSTIRRSSIERCAATPIATDRRPSRALTRAGLLSTAGGDVMLPDAFTYIPFVLATGPDPDLVAVGLEMAFTATAVSSPVDMKLFKDAVGSISLG